MRELPHTRSCFVCGESNPLGLQLRLRTDERVVETDYVASPHHVGFANTIHGGITTTLIDEIMAWACAVDAGHFAYCAELNVRFSAPIRPKERVVIRAWLTENKKGRIYLVASEAVNESGTVVATGRGKYIPVPDEEIQKMASDFVGKFEDVCRKTGG